LEEEELLQFTREIGTLLDAAGQILEVERERETERDRETERQRETERENGRI
jgi:hypothetical protein